MKDLLDLLWAFAVTVLIAAFGFAFYWAIGRFGEYQVKREATNQRILDNLAKPQWVWPHTDRLAVTTEADVRRIVREELNKQSQEK